MTQSPKIIVNQVSKIHLKAQHAVAQAFSLQKAIKSTLDIANTKTEQIIALDNITFTLNAGDRLGIVGPNGAGKSTLLSILANLSEPTSGTVTVDGHVTAIMTLGLGLREDLSGRENIYIDGEMQGKTRAEIDIVIEEIIAFADLGEFIDYPIRTYSTGMKARLAFSMIVTIDPQILIIDEALSVGDANFSQKATKKIQEICNRGKIVVIVSHGMESIVEMCNRCLWLDKGKIVMDGDPQTVTAAYADAVRQQDEQKLLRKFYSNEIISKGNKIIQNLKAHRIGQSDSQVLYRSGEDLAISFSLVLVEIEAIRIVMKITRSDGILIAQTSYIPQNSKHFQVLLRELVLAAGVYKIHMQVWNNDNLLDEQHVFIEIQTLNPPSGGRPALIYPAKAMLIEQQSSEDVCLDLSDVT